MSNPNGRQESLPPSHPLPSPTPSFLSLLFITCMTRTLHLLPNASLSEWPFHGQSSACHGKCHSCRCSTDRTRLLLRSWEWRLIQMIDVRVKLVHVCGASLGSLLHNWLTDGEVIHWNSSLKMLFVSLLFFNVTFLAGCVFIWNIMAL